MDLTNQKINEIINTITNNKGEIQMAVNTALYKVGDTYTSQKSKQTGVIKEIVPQANGNVRVKLEVEGNTRWTTWTPKAN